MIDRTGQTWRTSSGQLMLITKSEPHAANPRWTLHHALLLDDWTDPEDCMGHECGHCVGCARAGVLLSPVPHLAKGTTGTAVEFEPWEDEPRMERLA